jgi:hypothetical protein
MFVVSCPAEAGRALLAIHTAKAPCAQRHGPEWLWNEAAVLQEGRCQDQPSTRPTSAPRTYSVTPDADTAAGSKAEGLGRLPGATQAAGDRGKSQRRHLPHGPQAPSLEKSPI